MRPNLFSFATKELSQDAFITWLLKWASPECKPHDPQLSECSNAFVRKLLSLQIDPPTEITLVKAGRQWHNIDVWAEINNKYLLVIEDKVFSGQHSNQLQIYRETASAWCSANAFQLICVYLKTGSESASLLEKVTKNGFAVFKRRDFLAILNAFPVKNHIFVDFKEHLQALEGEENCFQAKAVKDWGDADWRGFYQALETRRPVHNWEFVNNPGRGFWNAVLNWNEIKDCCPYMQIEQGPLCFKVGEVYENRSEIRDRYHQLFMSHFANKADIRKPSRLRPGTYMTIGVIDRANWFGPDDSILDMDGVVARLSQYEHEFGELIKQWRAVSF